MLVIIEKTKRSIMMVVMAISMLVLLSGSARASEGDVWLTPAEQDIGSDENFSMEVHMDTGGKDLAAFNMYFDFDASFVGIDTTQGDDGIDKGVDATSYLLFPNITDIANGHLRFAGMAASGYANGNDVHLITIYTKTTAGFTADSTSLSLRINEISDELGGALTSGSITGATVSFPVIPDTTVAVLSNGQPSGVLPVGTTQTAISLSTDESATCKYSTSAGTAYASMTNTFSTTGGTSHSQTITGLTNGNSYSYYVRCQDASENANTSDFTISFSVAEAPDTTAPSVTNNGSSSGVLVAGTTSASLRVSTDESATCKYSTSAGTAYASMTNTFSTTGGTSHSQTITGLTNGNSYSYYVRCQDASENASATDITIGFSVASAAVVDDTDDTNETVNIDEGEAEVVQNDIDVEKPKFKSTSGDRMTKISSSKKMYAKDRKFSFKGGVDGLNGGKVVAYVNGDEYNDADVKKGEWKISVKTKKDATYSVKFKFYDANDNEVDESSKYYVKVDTENPDIYDLPSFLTKSRGEKLWWRAKDNNKIDHYKYSFIGGAIKGKETKSASIIIPANAPSGVHTMRVTAFDKAGNKDTKYVVVRVR
jgi:hypothetical protein